MRHPIGMRALVLHLRNELKNDAVSAEQKEQIKKLLGRGMQARHARNALLVRVQYKADMVGAFTGVVGKLGDGVILKFLFDHREEILAFVKEILQLFHIA